MEKLTIINQNQYNIVQDSLTDYKAAYEYISNKYDIAINHRNGLKAVDVDTLTICDTLLAAKLELDKIIQRKINNMFNQDIFGANGVI